MPLIQIQTQEENKGFKDVIFLLVADGLAQKVQHPQVEVILLDLSIADLEVVEERYD